MMGLRKLRACTKGSTVMEFALVAPAFVMIIFGIIEASRVFWIKQTLDEVAYSTARCMSVSSTCDSNAKAQSYAIDRARGYSVTLTAVQVTPVPGTTCKSTAGANSVAITKNIGAPMGGLIPMPSTLSATACFPTLT
ncbi:MAG: pilus assembly protein [Verrucomicrobiaceae bacterium]|nr:MAG: pilus assembly protein [Verrucomicrobiaceae bacterium]